VPPRWRCALAPADDTPLLRTPLHALHVALGARMVPFAGYEMPVQYKAGIIAEHLHTRAKAGLFDVSHMGQIALRGAGATGALETLVPGDLAALAPGRMRYTLLLNDAGGIIDDLMVTRRDDGFALVVNAARKEADLAHLRERLGSAVTIEAAFERALLALQGPLGATVLARFVPGIDRIPFMSAADAEIAGIACGITRSGYTGEDGYEISLAPEHAAAIAERLLAEPEVAPIGLGARDTLRLEAGLCLYGHDIDETTTPIEAGLAWTIGKRRREFISQGGGFPGAERILRELASAPARRRVGFRLTDRAPAREGSAILDDAGRPVGSVTSGGFAPTLNAPIAMGYVASEQATLGTLVSLVVRDVPRPALISAMPFVPTRYYRGP